MRRTLLPLLAGCLPLLAGWMQNGWMLGAWGEADLRLLPLLSVLFLLCWCVLGALTAKLAGSTRRTFVTAQLPTLVFLLLTFVQELILKSYWMNAVGLSSQLFFLPVLSLGFRLTPFFHSLPPTYLVCALLMAAAFWLGCRVVKKK